MNTKKNSESVDITRRDFNHLTWRWIFSSQVPWNYEKMMGSGYLFAMLPFLRKRYADKPDELKEMMRTENQFFNTTPYVAHLILGIDMAMQNEQGIEAKDAVTGIKTSLMGPLAGVGDTIFGVVVGTICGSIAGYLGLKGNITGLLIAEIVGFLILGLRFTFMPLGYKQGIKIVNEFGQRLNALTDSAILLGMTVVGALIPTVINAKVPLVFKSGAVKLSVQTDVLDVIMPYLIPAVLAFFVYWLLGRKGMTSTRVILIVMILGIVLYNLHILG